MQSAQESKQELEAAIRYAENAISSANKTIESMEFRQEMAKKQYSEQTGREEALTKQVQELEREVQRQQELGQGYYDSMMTFKAEVDKLRSEKEASSGPCGCQAYRDLEEARGRAEGEVELLQRTIADLEERATMPVIPKAVAIAIFREGMQHGVEAACTELEGQTIEIDENEYCGGFEVTFTKEIDLDDEIDLDWMRGKCGDYSEEFVIDALSNLCADKEFECRIHGIDDQEAKDNGESKA
jgi:predicted RNase H-like nuclease (RuvC/YqgF family)